MIYILVVLFFCFFILAYKLSNGDLIAPPILVTAGFFLSSLFALVLTGRLWSGRISAYSILIYILGICCFIVSFYSTYSLVAKNRRNRYVHIEKISIPSILIYTYIILSLIIAYLYFRSIISIVGNYGSWTDIMARYRLRNAYGNSINATATIPSMIAAARMFLQGGAYVFVYVLANNFVAEKKLDRKLIIALLVDIIASMVAAQRLDIIRIPISFIVFCFIFKRRNGELSEKQKIKLYSKFFVLAIVVLVFFAVSKSFVGRQTTGINALEYVAKYIGGPIPLFDDFLKEPAHSSAYVGMETFWGIYDMLHSITRNSMFAYDYTLEFRTIEGTNMGNVYSAFRMYYADFGILGVVLLSGILGTFFAILYSRILHQKGRRKISIYFAGSQITSKVDFELVFYAVIIHSCLLMFYQDWFFSHVIEWYQIKSFIFMWIFKVVMIDIPNINKKESRYETE